MLTSLLWTLLVADHLREYRAILRLPLFRYMVIWTAVVVAAALFSRFLISSWNTSYIVSQHAQHSMRNLTVDLDQLVQRQPDELGPYLRRYSDMSRRTQIAVYDRSGQRQAAYVADDLPEVLPSPPYRLPASLSSRLEPYSEQYLRLMHWHRLPDGRVLYLQQLVQRITMPPLAQLTSWGVPILLALIYILGQLVMLRRLFRPLVQMADQIGRLDQGRGRRLSIQAGQPEYGRIQTSINRIMQRLDERQIRFERNRQWSMAMLEHNPAALMQLDERQRVIYANPAALGVLGLTPSQVLERPLAALLPLPVGALTALQHDQAVYLLAERHEPEPGDGTGKLQRLKLAIMPFAAQELAQHALVWMQDHTAILDGQQQAQQQLAELQEQVAYSDRMLATMSHELRTPLNGILGMLQLLNDTALNEEQAEYIHTLNVSGQAMLHLVNDILDMAKLNAGQMQLERTEFDLLELAQEVIDLMAAPARNKGLEAVLQLDPGLPRHLQGDAHRIRQILLNLLNNAIKFTSQGYVALRITAIEPSVRPSPATPDPAETLWLQFLIEDTGLGIDPPSQAGLFAFFRQTDASVARRFGGTGLGLAISRSLAEAMNGHIGLQSESGQGSQFWLQLPLKPVDGQCLVNPQHDFRIQLVVLDANPVMQASIGQLAAYLGLACHQLMTVDVDTLVSLPLLPALQPVILMDMALVQDRDLTPVQIRQQVPALRQAHFILTSMVKPRHIEPGLFEQFEGYVSKPVHVRHLLAELTRISNRNLLDDVLTLQSPLGNQSETGHTTAETVEAFLSRQLQQPAVEPASMQPPVDDQNDLILVAEDNAVNRKVVSKMLERLGYRCIMAENGQEAVNLLEQHRRQVRLILMDFRMPIMDGLEATREIRARNYSLPIVALTANDTDEDRLLCQQAGMDDFMAKPIRQETLAAMMQRFM